MRGHDGAPGAIIVADEDGVALLSQERPKEVLKQSQKIDGRERGMFPFIRQRELPQKAVEAFSRI